MRIIKIIFPVLLLILSLLILSFSLPQVFKYAEVCTSSIKKQGDFHNYSEAIRFPFLPDTDVQKVILFIGDGMGINQIAATRIKTYGPNGRLNIERMPVTGFLCTHSSGNLITDSAASATALATGWKIKNKMVALACDSSQITTILEAARGSGLSTGLVATSTITHATPACFAAHVPSRNDYSDIARQYLEAKVNVLLGGGKEHFIPKSSTGSSRTDELDLIGKAEKMGYQFVETREELKSATSSFLLGLFELAALTGKEDEPTLAELTDKAIDILSQNAKGFFLMVEGSQIDWAGHQNNFDYLTRETIEFDKAVRVGIDFAMADGHTLVVVTADHETGGLAITGGETAAQEIEIGWISKSHTGTPVPLFAFGPHAIRFTGLRDNTEIPIIFADLLGIKGFPKEHPSEKE